VLRSLLPERKILENRGLLFFISRPYDAVPEETADLLNRGVSVAGIAAREADDNGVAGKWRRNSLKTLNPRREMVWARTPRTPRSGTPARG
jgi:hypothetical protein